jgi:long-chain acyl-CoA synthetase
MSTGDHDNHGGDIVLARKFRRLASERGAATALRQKELGIWRDCSWTELAAGVDEVAAGLLDLQVQPGEVVAIVSSACRDWVLADLGGQSAAAVVAGLHALDTAAAIHQHLCALAVRVLFVEDDALFEAIAQAGDLPLLRHVIVFRTEGLRRATDPRLMSLHDLRERGAQALAQNPIQHPTPVERALASCRETDDAIIVSTVGATGGTRVLRLSHRAVHAACAASAAALSGPAAARKDRLLFLPLGHAVERIGALYSGLIDGAILHFVEGQDTVFDNLREVQPAVLQAFPRFWERLHSNLVTALNEATATGQWCYRQALSLGGAGQGATTATRWAHTAMDRLVLANLRRMMGLDRLRLGVVVGAPVAADLIQWFRAMGVDLRHAWHCAELGGYVCIAGPDDAPDTVGLPLPGHEVRVSGDGKDGELLVRSTALSSDSPWHPTGDLGSIDASGRVHVTGRIDDRIVGMDGQAVQPAQIERLIKASPYVTDAVVVGQARPHLACLVVLNRESVEQWAQKRQLPFSDLRSLCDSGEVMQLISGEIQRTAGAYTQALRAIKLVDMYFDGDPRMYTPALTLKRVAMLERFAPAIEDLYRSASA